MKKILKLFKRKSVKVVAVILALILIAFGIMNAIWFYQMNKLIYPAIRKDEMVKEHSAFGYGTDYGFSDYDNTGYRYCVYIRPYFDSFFSGWWGQLSVGQQTRMDENGYLDDYVYGLLIQPKPHENYVYIFGITDYSNLDDDGYGETILFHIGSDLTFNSEGYPEDEIKLFNDKYDELLKLVNAANNFWGKEITKFS